MDKREEFLKELKVEIGDMQDIPVEDNDEKDYENWRQARAKRLKESPKWDIAKKRMEQKELLEDLENEFNERNRGGYGR